MDFPPLYRWLAVSALALLVFAWHWQQNRKYAAQLAATGRQQDVLARKLLSLSFDRAIILLFVWGLLLGSMIFLDQRNNALLTRLAQKDAELSVANEMLSEEIAGPSNPAPDILSESYQQELDSLKERFEQLFITYYYLKRCNLVSPQDFHIMVSSLSYELSRMDAPASLRGVILQAAKGSHDEMYATAACEDKSVAPMKANVDKYLQSVVSHVPDSGEF